MTCQIDYLDNNYQGDELNKLRTKHFNIVKQIADSKLFYKKDGKYSLSKDVTSTRRKEQERFVSSIPELSVVQDGELEVLSLKVDGNFKDNKMYQKNGELLNAVYEKTNRNLFISKFYNDKTLIKNLKINDYFSEFPKEMVLYFEFLLSKKSFKTVQDLVYYTYSDFFKNDYYALNNMPINKSLESKLKLFLEKYNITISEKTKHDLKNKYGFNILGVYDIINKNIEIVKENERSITTLPEEISHAILEIMGTSYKHSEKYRELSNLVTDWEGYKTIYKEYSKIYTDSLGNVDWKMVKKEAIGKALMLALLETENPSLFKKSKHEQNLLLKIKSLFIKFIDFISQDFRKSYNNKEFKNLINEIAKNVLNENYDFFEVLDSSEFKTLLYEETIKLQNLEDNGKAVDIMQTISNNNGSITGSLAIRKLAELKRKSIDNLHDIDVIFSSKDFNPNITDIFNISLNDIYESVVVKDLQKKYGKQLQLFSNWSNKFENYAAIHFYITEDPDVTNIFKNTEGRLSKLYENLAEEQKQKTILIDIFIDDKHKYTPIKDLQYNINLTPIYASFIAKIFNMGRTKDVFDYQTLKYYEESYKVPIPDKRNYLFQIEPNTEFDDYVDYDVDNVTIRETHEFASYLNESEDNETKFLDIVKDLRKRFNDYINLLSDGLVDYPSEQRDIKISELKALRNQLNTESVEDAVIGLSNYVSDSVQWIDIIHNEYFTSEKNIMSRIKKLNDLEGEERENEIYELTKVINKSTQFLYLFKGLSDFKDELQRDNFIPKDKFNSKFYNSPDLFKQEMDLLAVPNAEQYYKLFDKNISFTTIKENIINDKNFATYQESLDFKIKLDEAFDRNVKNTFTAQMSKSLGKAEELKSQIKDLHFKLTTEFLFPEFDTIQQSNKDSNIEKVTKKQFEALLKVADKDENFITSWLESTIQSNDPLVNMTAKKLSNAMFKLHLQNVDTAKEIEDLRKPILELSKTDQKKVYDSFTNKIYVLKEDDWGNPIEIDINDNQSGIVVNTLLGEKRYLTQEASAFKTGKNTAKAESIKKLANYVLFKQKVGEDYGLLNKAITEHKNDNLYNYLVSLKQVIPEINNIILELYETVDGNVKLPVRLKDKYLSVDGEAQNKLIKETIKNKYLQYVVHDKVDKNYTVKETTELLNKQGITLDNYKEHLDYLKNNSTKNSNLVNFLNKSRSKDKTVMEGHLSMIDNNGKERFMVEVVTGVDTTEIQFKTLREILPYVNGVATINPSIKNVFLKKYELVDLQDSYKLPTYNGLHKDYFDKLYEVYQKQNATLGRNRLKHGIIPQIEKSGITDLTDAKSQIKSLWQSIMDFFVDAYSSIKKAISEFDAVPDTDEAKNTFEQEYLNGEKIKQIGISYTSILDNQDNVEWDLAHSVGAYSFMVNHYNVLKKYDPQMRVIRTIVLGDTMLGIDQRKAKKTNINGKYIRKTRSRKDEENYKKDIAKNLNGKIVEFIDEMMYDEADYLNFGLGKSDLNKIGGAISGYTTYTNLALNLMGMFSNITNGKVSTYLESVQGEYFTTKDYREAEYEYAKNIPNHYNDFITPNLQDKSKVGQLLIMLDAIQGEYLDDFASITKQKSWSDALKTALFFTQNGAEHWIQTVNMIAMLKADGLWDEIKHTPGQLITFTKEQEARLRVFQGKLHSVNKRLNGAYAKIDKSRLQRRWIGRMVLMFRKYIWQAYKTRFQNERLDVESTDIVQGYVNAYYSDFIKEMKSNQSIAWKALRAGKQLLQDNRRLLLGVGNLVSGGMLNKNINVKSAYGLQNKSDKEIAQAQRYIAEMSLFVAFTVAGAVLGSMGDDDEDELVLDNLELLMKRQRGDMGAFLPTMINIPTADVGAFSTTTFIKKTVSSPIPSMRSIDNSISLLQQIVGVEYGAEGLNFTFNDTYDKSGAGYEKGDLKLTRKIDKSLVSPYWQIMKLLSPKEQLQYLEMINKNNI